MPGTTVARPWRFLWCHTRTTRGLTRLHMVPTVVPMIPPESKPNGAAIREFRERAKLSANRVALHIGVTRQYLRRLEQGQRGATEDTLKKLAEALDVPYEAITCLVRR